MKLRHSYAFIPLLLAACTSSPPVKTVKYVDRDRFMGSWYVQAGRFTMFESDPYNAVETYTWNDKEKRIDIDFHYNKGSSDGPLKEIPQKAWIENDKSNAHWKVQPFWPIKADYLVIGLDDNYTWTAIGVPGQKYLWVMTRDSNYPREKLQDILKKVKLSGYSIDDIEYVEHSK